jgi:hypothetical protein
MAPHAQPPVMQADTDALLEAMMRPMLVAGRLRRLYDLEQRARPSLKE